MEDSAADGYSYQVEVVRRGVAVAAERQVARGARFRQQAVGEDSAALSVGLHDQRRPVAAEAQQPRKLPEESAVPLAAPQRKIGNYVGGGQRELVLGEEADGVVLVAVLPPVEAGGRAATGDVEVGTVAELHEMLEYVDERGGVEDRLLLPVAVGGAWPALDPGDDLLLHS